MTERTQPQFYRKKPVAVEAIQLNIETIDRIVRWIRGGGKKVSSPTLGTLIIHTLEGDMKAEPGDYIIRGVRGEFYPCKPDIFEDTYDAA